MIENVENFLTEFDLLKPEKTFLVGFSGGCDSLCLLDILNQLADKHKFKLIALHLNHNWRGEESQREEEACRAFCEKMKINFISETLQNVQKTENSAREARYEFFTRVAKNHPNSAIFTAHTQTDNAETVIYRIIKGTGVCGLQGIPPMRLADNIPVYRPLLNISRQKVEDYCNSKGLVANTDSSNFDMNYKRNFIRHKIMPLFNEINFHSEKSINSLSEIATSQCNIVNEYLDSIKKDLYDDGKVLTQKFRTLSDDVMKKFIYDGIMQANLEYDKKKIKNILAFIKSNFDSKAGSTYSLTNDLWLFADSKHIYPITNTKSDEIVNEINIKNEGEFSVTNEKVFSIEKFDQTKPFSFPAENALFAYVDLSNTEFNFTLRTRRDGDVITPFGMNGKMKLKKYLNAKGVSHHKRDGLFLLCQGAEALWVVGVGLSNKLKVVNKPTHVIRLKNKD